MKNIKLLLLFLTINSANIYSTEANDYKELNEKICKKFELTFKNFDADEAVKLMSQLNDNNYLPFIHRLIENMDTEDPRTAVFYDKFNKQCEIQAAQVMVLSNALGAIAQNSDQRNSQLKVLYKLLKTYCDKGNAAKAAEVMIKIRDDYGMPIGISAKQYERKFCEEVLKLVNLKSKKNYSSITITDNGQNIERKYIDKESQLESTSESKTSSQAKKNQKKKMRAKWRMDLHQAALAGNVDAIHDLAKGYNINALNETGHTPLHKATTACRLQAVKALLELGADKTIKSAAGILPLHIAAANCDNELSNDSCKILYLLINDPLVKNLEERTPFGKTILHIAAERGNIQLVAKLIGIMLDPFAVTDNGWTLLHCAASCGHIEMIKNLIKIGLNIFARTGSDETFIHIAQQNGYNIIDDELRKMLVDKGFQLEE